MPLDPSKLYPKRRPKHGPEILQAVEWSAIVFAFMLAILFLSWALALQSAPETASFTAGEVHQPTSDSAATSNIPSLWP